MHALKAVSPIDGRYAGIAAKLTPYFSEAALIRFRAYVEIEWLKALSTHTHTHTHGVPRFTSDTQTVLTDILRHLGFRPDGSSTGSALSDDTLAACAAVKSIEKTTNHDVKAVEYYLKDAFAASGNKQLLAATEFLHFACTSEDISNLAYACAMSRARSEVLLPAMTGVVDGIVRMCEETADVPMMCRTHGQPATPSTMGKELAIFAFRLARQLRQARAVPVLGKFGGAVGNYNAHLAAFPDIAWEKVGADFVQGQLGITYNPYCTQIESHDWLAELFHAVSRFNTVLLDFDRDMWGYISLGYFRQRAVAGEVGSSTMPHKVNPIDFENSEGNIGVANALMSHMAEKLPVSRFQRDLSDSTVLRNIGTALTHSLIAYNSTQRGMSRVSADAGAMKRDLDSHAEVLGEAIQTVMRRYGAETPYEKLKDLTRGKVGVDADVMRDFIATQAASGALPADAASNLQKLTPSSYTGIAADLARSVRKRVQAELA